MTKAGPPRDAAQEVEFMTATVRVSRTPLREQTYLRWSGCRTTAFASATAMCDPYRI